MTLTTEQDFQAARARLEHLIDHEPSNLAEIKALGDAVDQYEKTHGHEPLDPDSLIYRLERLR